MSADLLRDGTLNLDLISGIHDRVSAADTTLSTAKGELGAIDTTALIGQVADGVDSLSVVVDQASAIVAGLDDAAEILPGMLGADEPRTVLIVLQNNAELRTGGGLTGSYLEFRADGGHLELVRQSDSSEFHKRESDILPIPDSTNQLYEGVGRYVQNTTMTPDFTLSAQLAAKWWTDLTGTIPDSVIAIDPLVVRGLLAAVGPTTLPDGTELNADNLVQTLMVAPYLLLNQDEQTAYLQTVASVAMNHVLSVGSDPLGWISAVTTAVDDGRISAWSADADEEKVLAGTTLAGPLVRHELAGDNAFAVYFNDFTGGKLDTFLDVTIDSGTVTCRDDGRSEVAVQVALTSNAPADAATLPLSMTGGGHYGVPAGNISTLISVAAPPGWFAGGVRNGDALVVSTNVEDGGFPTSAAAIELTPGSSGTLEFRFTAPDADVVSPTILHTPLVHRPTLGTYDPACG